MRVAQRRYIFKNKMNNSNAKLDMDKNENDRDKDALVCPSCGAPSVDGLDGCLALFGTLGAREFSDTDYFPMHRLTVDAYCLQHPEQYMVSTKSAAAHLAAMCWSMEIGRSIHMPVPLQLWVDGPRTYVRIPPPPFRERGSITIADVIGAKNPKDYETQVWKWAKSAWCAWSNHWEQARAWTQAAIGEFDVNKSNQSNANLRFRGGK